MNTRFKFIIVLFTALALQSTLFAFNYENNARELYDKGKKHCLKQEWQKAVDTFQEFITQYPESQYVDDVQFWHAYSLEKMPNKKYEAFEIFSNLPDDFPDSPWADDAVVHQIQLAEEFAGTGDEVYLVFLRNKLNSGNHGIRYRAAISLGKLGERIALPVLHEMTVDQNLGRLALSLIERLESIEQGEEIPVTDAPERLKRNERGTKRFKLYYSLLRKDDGWTWEELRQFGLWHILEEDEFVEYYGLQSEFDRTQWYENYWAKIGEQQNWSGKELRNEFERRVAYSRSHFGAPAEHAQSNYLRYSYLKKGDFRAPWDARGELYIKYGEPYTRYLHGVFAEHWDYPDYNIDFIVYQYQTNIRRNAICDGPVTNGLYDHDKWRFELDFILNQEFFYNANFESEAFQEYDFEVQTSEQSETGTVTVKYSIPRAAFEPAVLEQKKHLIAAISYSIKDQKNKLTGSDNLRVVPIDDNEDNLTGKIVLNLRPGEYDLKFSIEDLASYKRLDVGKAFTVVN
jgi:hypothetical protein